MELTKPKIQWWTEEEEQVIIDHYENRFHESTSNHGIIKEIAAKLSVKPDRVKIKVERMRKRGKLLR